MGGQICLLNIKCQLLKNSNFIHNIKWKIVMSLNYHIKVISALMQTLKAFSEHTKQQNKVQRKKRKLFAFIKW